MSGPTDLQPGDIAAAIRELDMLARFCRAASRDYRSHPAADELERGINHARSDASEKRAAGYERVMNHLAGELIRRQKPTATQETSHVG
ncbi:MAG TPA: hypothetical protein PKC67_02400 [Kiritimatiellia bacterium]|nr:hypothetical protein [Kiritimatiellia bacterium]HMP33176.1 hypothetical protein [Kiritimatiellia bacterium]